LFSSDEFHSCSALLKYIKMLVVNNDYLDNYCWLLCF